MRPLIAAEFLEPRERGAARAALGLGGARRVVVVSGGGWGVGDLEGAVEELLSLADVTVICVAGRNEDARVRLAKRFAPSDRVRVLGFTDRMPDLLAAADVLVHSTGGVTCLEAMARGCPVVSYGLPVGHAKLNTKRMAEHEFLLLADTPAELVEHVERGCATRALRPALPIVGAAIDAASAVLSVSRRVRPIARWRLRMASVGAALTLAAGGGIWVLSTDELDALASVIVHPVGRVKTTDPAVAVIVSTSSGDVPAVVRRLARDGLEASIATTTAPRRAALALLVSSGDESIPQVDRSHGLLGWIHTSSHLRHEARALHLHRHFFYLEPRNPTFGQLLLGRTAGGTPVRGSVALGARTPVAQLRKGDTVVVRVGSSASSLHELDRLARALHSDSLAGLPLSVLER